MGQQKFLKLMRQEEELIREQQNMQAQEAEWQKDKAVIEEYIQREREIREKFQQLKKWKRKRRRIIRTMIFIGMILGTLAGVAVHYIYYEKIINEYSADIEIKLNDYRKDNEAKLEEYWAELEE